MTFRLPALALLLAMLAVAPATAAAGTDEDARAQNAVRVLTDIQAIPDSAIPDKLLDEAHAIVVVPDSIKAGLVIGRSEESRVGKECVSTCKSRGSPYP